MKKIILTAFMLMVSLLGAIAQDADSLYAKNLLKSGALAPDFLLPQVHNDKLLSPRNLLGKYVLLEFWASWCGDCRKDLPTVWEERKKWDGEHLSFVGISFDTDKDAWKNAIKKYNLKYHQVSELKKMKESQIAADYHISWIPSYYLLDKENRIILATVEFSKIQNKLAELAQAGEITKYKKDSLAVQAQFPGGKEVLLKYLAVNVKYPSSAKGGINCKVAVEFVVDTDGTIKNPFVKRVSSPQVSPSLATKYTHAEQQEIIIQAREDMCKEALRVVRSMPRWTPGISSSGKAVRVKYTIPINFRGY